MGIEATCPACAAAVEFSVANSLVVVCDSCQSLVGRADGRIEDYGKVAELVEIDSPLRLGLQGHCQGDPFEVTGRIQLEHAAGGTWNEWYLAFSGGESWGWLAEAQGRYQLTYRQTLPGDSQLPSPDRREVHQEVSIPGAQRMKVVEIGKATTRTAEGELPFRPNPGETVSYADLSGPQGEVATIDGSETPPLLFYGSEVSLEQLGLGDAGAAFREKRRTAAVQVNCPSCAAPLTIQSPDESLRVACGYCGALHDCDQGNLALFAKLDQSDVQPLIPLGSTGTLGGKQLTVIGFLQRFVTWRRKRYPWQEYLLSCPGEPFQWLIQSEDHWSLGSHIPAGEVVGSAADPRPRARGMTFRIYEKSVPETCRVLGEFYWKVQVGERADAIDFIRPPWMLSREATMGDDSQQEINYTLSRYVPVAEVAGAFDVKLPRPNKVGKLQPNLHLVKIPVWFALLTVAFLIVWWVYQTAPGREVYRRSIRFNNGASFDTPSVVDGEWLTQTVISEPFSLQARQNIRIRCRAPGVDNSWAYVDGNLYNEETGVVVRFGVEVSYYHGVSGGESWREGGSTSSVFLSAVPAGTYSVRLVGQRSSITIKSIGVQIHQGVPRRGYAFVLLIGLFLAALVSFLRYFGFEQARWIDSDYSPYSNGD